MVVICGEFLNMILDIFKFHGVDIHSEFLQMFNSIPVVQQRIEICEQLSGEYAENLYKEIMEGK